MLAFQIIHFLLLLWILRKLLYGPLSNMLEERKAKIADALAEAERVSTMAASERATLEAQIAEERRTSHQKLTESVARGDEAAKKRVEEATVEAERIVAQARADASQARNEALSGLQGDVADLALAAAARVVGSSIDEKQHRGLIDNFLKEQLGDLA